MSISSKTLQYVVDTSREAINMEMKVRVCFAVFTVTMILIQEAAGARILGVFPTHTPSHYVMYGSLMRAMAAKGHHVTVVSHFPSKKPIKNFIDVSLDGTMPALYNNISIDVPLAMSPMGNHLDNIYDCIESCEVAMNHPDVLALLDPKHKFDLFVTEIFGSECFLAFAHKLGIPAVGVVSSVTLPWVNDMVANPDNPAYVPLYFYPLTQRMNFIQRVYNTVMSIIIKVSYEILANWSAQKVAEDVMGPLPSISNMAKNFSMILINSHFSINQVRPWVPQIVEVGGLHISKPKTLPQEIQKFLDESTDGVVYFSFGSMIQIESIPKEKLQQIIDVLGSLKQKVLWKVDEANLPKLPKNIKTGLWMPQREILCHPNAKVFISHGGLLGTQEAITCGVPILGVPLFADQALNLAELNDRGVVQIINYHDLNKNTLSRALDKLINDTSFKSNMEHLSQIFTDRPQHPMDTAIYWLEYVIKYKGARHLRSAALDLAWYQYLLLDVLAFVLVSIAIIIYIAKLILRKVMNNTTKNSEKDKNIYKEDNAVNCDILNANDVSAINAYNFKPNKQLINDLNSLYKSRDGKVQKHGSVTEFFIYLLFGSVKKLTILTEVDHSKIE